MHDIVFYSSIIHFITKKESSIVALEDGFGYVALNQVRVCAVAFSAAVSSDEIDIGVETYEHRA